MIFLDGSMLQHDYDADANPFLGTMEQFSDPINTYMCFIMINTLPDSTVKVKSKAAYHASYEKYIDIKKQIAIINNKKTDDMDAYMSTLRKVRLPMVEPFER